MRSADGTPLDPEISAALDAIDGTLAGEPVDPRHAELAELALLLAAERPMPDPAFATVLDEGVQRRFGVAQQPAGRPARSLRRWRLWAPAAGLATAAVAAIAVVIGTSGGGGQIARLGAAGQPSPEPSPGAPSHGGATAQALPAASGVRRAVSSSPGAAVKSAAPSATAGALIGPSAGQAPVLAPPANGRKIVQSAQLSLTTASSRIETVAQEVFDVVGQERGIVNSSTVTATGSPGGYAEFQLSLPSSSLVQAMAALSGLRYAHVASRTDTTQDVNNQYQADVRRLADARALRTSLLGQLASATTAAQIQSLTAQIHDAEASISSDEATLRGLNGQVDYSQVTVTINGPSPAPVPLSPGGGGFTLGRAAHDAGRVLTVAAGAALIAAAALVPIGLLAALGWWAATVVRRRRRERALDLA